MTVPETDAGGWDRQVRRGPSRGFGARELFHEDVAIPGTTLTGFRGLSERSVRRSGDIGSPPPPRRFHGHEVFRRSACRMVRRPSGGSRRLRHPLRVLARVPSPVPKDRIAPPGVSCPYSGFSGGIRMTRANHGPAPSVLGVSHPLDGLLSLRPCGHAGSAAAHGVLAHRTLSNGKAENALPRLLRPFVHGALQSRTLRNTRSRAPQPPRHLCLSALVPRPWFQSPQAPSEAHHSRIVAEAFAPTGPLTRLSPRHLGEP
jgi:hypothetical protein